MSNRHVGYLGAPNGVQRTTRVEDEEWNIVIGVDPSRYNDVKVWHLLGDALHPGQVTPGVQRRGIDDGADPCAVSAVSFEAASATPASSVTNSSE